MDTWLGYLRRGLARRLPEDPLAGRRGARADLRHLRPFLARHWPKGLLGALLILFASLLGFPQPLLNRMLIDDAILGRQLDVLAVAILLMIGVSMVEMLIGLLQQWFFVRFEQAVVLDIQQDLLSHTLRLPKSFFDEQEVGYLLARLSSDVGGLRWFFSGTLVQIVTNVVHMVGGVAFLFYLEWRLALVALVIVPGLWLWARYFAPRTRALSHQSMERRADVSRRMQESLSAAALIKAFVSEEHEVGRVVAALRSAFDVSLEQTAVGAVAGVSLSALNSVANMVILTVGAYLVITGYWTLGSLLAFRSYVGYVYGPARFLANVHLQLQNALAALERVSALYDIVPEESGAGVEAVRLNGEVELRAVSFAYDAKQPVLQDVSCHVQPGARVAIVGPSGVGKTTLISLLMRFYKPTAGEIWFDGRPAADYEVRSLRRRIGYVSQSTLLLSGTIADNLRYGNPEAAEEELVRAAQVAGIHDFVAGLPEGYATPVGERGANLSEGQKQRLSLARALLKHPDILVLDEPTASLDSLVERSIFDALPDAVQGKTLFVVAHRLSTVQDSDCILLLNENRLVAIGAHRSLLDESALYRELVANQQIR